VATDAVLAACRVVWSTITGACCTPHMAAWKVLGKTFTRSNPFHAAAATPTSRSLFLNPSRNCFHRRTYMASIHLQPHVCTVIPYLLALHLIQHTLPDNLPPPDQSGRVGMGICLYNQLMIGQAAWKQEIYEAFFFLYSNYGSK
jgi:hypothetical protein